MNNFYQSRLSAIGKIATTFILFFSTIPLASVNAQAGTRHLVSKGDTLSGIAQKYRVSQKSILNANNKKIRSANLLLIGQKLYIPAGKASLKPVSILYKVESGDTVWSIARRHGVPEASILQTNGIKSPRRLKVGMQLLISNQENGGFLSPLRVRSYVTSGYGTRRHPISRRMKFHHGIDLGVRPRTRVYAARSGKVIRAGWYGGYGNVVVIKHDEDYTTRYGHLSKIRVKVGQRVTPQQIIGLSGSSGHATGPHLHFEIRWKGDSVDASRYIRLP